MKAVSSSVLACAAAWLFGAQPALAVPGATQVVVLGAGFDSRAYRFRRSHPELRSVEVDLPATIEL